MTYFTDMLDNAADALTIEIEVAPLDSFQNIEEVLACSDEEDYQSLCKIAELIGNPPVSREDFDKASLIHDLFNLIRNVWDAAYSHGYYDGLVECDEADILND